MSITIRRYPTEVDVSLIVDVDGAAGKRTASVWEIMHQSSQGAFEEIRLSPCRFVRV